MKVAELVENKSDIKIYLDMDGVLANFFAEYAKMANVESYRDIPPAKVDPILKKMVGTDFFSRLPKFPTADALVKLVLTYVDHYNICSSPLRGDVQHSGEQKKIWLKQNLNPQPRDVIITSIKERHAQQPDGTPNILIDDRGTNISAWRANGGIGIKYQADEDSLQMVKQELDKAFSTLKEYTQTYSLDPNNLSYTHKVGKIYGKKNLKVPHAKYVDKRTKT
jgi:5'(3')-deoxyribonucleotidase